MLLALLLFDIALAATCAMALSRSPRLEAEVAPLGGDQCAWTIELSSGKMCLQEIAGVKLTPLSLVREPLYLPSRGDIDRWLAEQRALYEATAGKEEVVYVARSLRPGGQTGNDSPGAGQTGAGGTRAAKPPPTLKLSGLPAKVILRDIVPLGLTTLVHILIGFIVFLRRPDHSASWSLLTCSQACAAMFMPTIVNSARGLCIPPGASRLLLDLNLAAFLVGGVAFVYLAASFPEARFGRHTPLIACVIPAVLAAGSFCLEVFGGISTVLIFTAGAVLAALLLIIFAQLWSRGQTRLLQSRWVLWGFAVPVVLWIVIRVPYSFLPPPTGEDPTDQLVLLSSLAIPTGIAAAIVRYRLLDIDIVVRRTIYTALITALVLFLYSLGVSAFAHELSAEAGGPGTVFITAVVLAFMLLPAQSGLERALDRLLFRNRFHYRQVLAKLPDALVSAETPDEAATLVLAPLCEVMRSKRAVTAIAPRGGAQPRFWPMVAAGSGPAQAALEVPAGAELWGELAAVEQHHFCDLDDESSALDRYLAAAGLDLAVPLRTPDTLVGMLACATPSGQLTLPSDDVAALRTVASGLALAFSRTLALETIREMNEQLEQRVADRTDELAQARLQLYQWEKMASLGALAAGVAHELNTPLGVVISTTDQLLAQHTKQGDAGSRPQRLARLCHQAAKQAATIINDLHSYTRPDTQHPSLVKLDEVIDSTLRLLDSSLRRKRIEVTVSRAELPAIEGYPVLIGQTLTNLVRNAIGAVAEGGRITIITEPRGEHEAALIVEDNGPGIPPDCKGRIFEPFFTTKAPGEGTGLGLSVCYTCVEEHGGTIWEEGTEGARFVVQLPFKRRPPKQGAQQSQRGAGPAASPRRPPA